MIIAMSSLSFLRTCKQISNECKDIIWKYNALDIEALIRQKPSNHSSLDYVDDKITSRVEAVQMNLCFTDKTRLSDGLVLNGSLWALSNWYRLKRVTLVARGDSDDDPTILGHSGLQAILWYSQHGPRSHAAYAVHGDTVYHEVLDILRHFALREPHLEREIIMNLGIPMFDEQGKPARSIKRSKNPAQLLNEVGKALGGRLVVDGELCYENGNVVHEMFTQWTRNSDFYYKKDLMAWRLAGLISYHTMSRDGCMADFFYVLAHMDAFATDAVRTFLEKYLGTELCCTAKFQTLEARTDLWDAIRDRDISRFLSLLPA